MLNFKDDDGHLMMDLPLTGINKYCYAVILKTLGSESMMVKGYDFKSILTSNETLYDF